MDPYLERRDLWPDVHQRLITYSADTLQPQIRPRYHARIGERLYVIPPHRSIYPDVTVTQRQPATTAEGRGVAALMADAPMVIAVAPEEVREPFIEILDLAHGGRVVTVIEVLSPANKCMIASQCTKCRIDIGDDAFEMNDHNALCCTLDRSTKSLKLIEGAGVTSCTEHGVARVIRFEAHFQFVDTLTQRGVFSFKPGYSFG